MTRRRILIAAAVLVVALAALWWATGGFTRTVEARIADRLAEQGVPGPMADCMGARMAERLSVNQLRELEKLGPAEGEVRGRVTIAELLERARSIDDPQVIEVTATAAAVCAFTAG